MSNPASSRRNPKHKSKVQNSMLRLNSVPGTTPHAAVALHVLAIPQAHLGKADACIVSRSATATKTQGRSSAGACGAYPLADRHSPSRRQFPCPLYMYGCASRCCTSRTTISAAASSVSCPNAAVASCGAMRPPTPVNGSPLGGASPDPQSSDGEPSDARSPSLPRGRQHSRTGRVPASNRRMPRPACRAVCCIHAD
jgi:hypothetical protein